MSFDPNSAMNNMSNMNNMNDMNEYQPLGALGNNTDSYRHQAHGPQDNPDLAFDQQSHQYSPQVGAVSAVNNEPYYPTGPFVEFSAEVNNYRAQAEPSPTGHHYMGRLNDGSRDAFHVAHPHPGYGSPITEDPYMGYPQSGPSLPQMAAPHPGVDLSFTHNTGTNRTLGGLYARGNSQSHSAYNNLDMSSNLDPLDEFTDGRAVYTEDGRRFQWKDFYFSLPPQKLFFFDETEFDWKGFVAFVATRFGRPQPPRAPDQVAPRPRAYGLSPLGDNRTMSPRNSFSDRNSQPKKATTNSRRTRAASNAASSSGQSIFRFANEAAYKSAIATPAYVETSDCPTDDAGKRVWVDKIASTLRQTLRQLKTQIHTGEEIEKKAWEVFIKTRDEFHGQKVLSDSGRKKYANTLESFDSWSEHMNTVIDAIGVYQVAKMMMDEPFIARVISAPAAESGRKKGASLQASRKKLKKADSEIASARLAIREAEDQQDVLQVDLITLQHSQNSEKRKIDQKLQKLDGDIEKAGLKLEKAKKDKAEAEKEIADIEQGGPREEPEEDSEVEAAPSKKRKLRQAARTESEPEMRSGNETTAEPVDPAASNRAASREDVDLSYPNTRSSRATARSSTEGVVKGGKRGPYKKRGKSVQD